MMIRRLVPPEVLVLVAAVLVAWAWGIGWDLDAGVLWAPVPNAVVTVDFGPVPFEVCQLQNAVVGAAIRRAEEDLPLKWSVWAYNTWFVHYVPADCHPLARPLLL